MDWSQPHTIIQTKRFTLRPHPEPYLAVYVWGGANSMQLRKRTPKTCDVVGVAFSCMQCWAYLVQ